MSDVSGRRPRSPVGRCSSNETSKAENLLLIASKAREADLKKMSYGGANESAAVEEGKGGTCSTENLLYY